MVQAIERVGSSSGSTSAAVVIAKCGEIEQVGECFESEITRAMDGQGGWVGGAPPPGLVGFGSR